MRKTVLLAAVALGVAGCANQEALERMDAQTDAALAEELAGWAQAGPPQNCVSQRMLRSNRSVGEGAIIFETSGDRVYVNRPTAGCPSLRLGRALVTRTTSSQLCSGDIATVFDPVSGSEYGACGLGEFTPYQRVE